MSKFLIAALALILLGLAIYSPNIVRLYKLANLYNEKSIAKNFININKIFETSSPIPASEQPYICLLYTSPSPRDMRRSRMPSSA